MIRRIAPQFFAAHIATTLAYYKDRLGFDCLGTWQDPPVYAIVARDGQAIHFFTSAQRRSRRARRRDQSLRPDVRYRITSSTNEAATRIAASARVG
jgi:hypothetical protein